MPPFEDAVLAMLAGLVCRGAGGLQAAGLRAVQRGYAEVLSGGLVRSSPWWWVLDRGVRGSPSSRLNQLYHSSYGYRFEKGVCRSSLERICNIHNNG